jgi:hypothetical protein
MFPVHVFRIQLDLCHFPDDMVHVSGFLGCSTCRTAGYNGTSLCCVLQQLISLNHNVRHSNDALTAHHVTETN